MADPQPLIPRRRRRPAKSCQECRSRKIRCDQKMPCAACVRSRAPLQCSYWADPSGVGAIAPRSASSNATDLLSGSVTMFTPESSAGSLPGLGVEPLPSRSHDVDPGVLQTSQSSTTMNQQERTIRELRRQVHQLEHQLASAKQPTPTPSGITSAPGNLPSPSDQPLIEASRSSETCILPTRPKLRNTSHKTKLFGPSHWVHTAEKFQVLGKFDAMNEVEASLTAAQAELTNIIKETRSLRKTAKAQEAVQLNEPFPDLLGTLPAKAICNELVHAYFRTFESIYRIVHVPTFWKEYNLFWEEPNMQPLPIHFRMKLVLILSIGTTFFSESSPKTQASSLQRQAQQWIYAAQWWLTGPSEKTTATLDGLQVSCLLILARQTVNKGPGRSTWVSTGSLIAMAQSMGLHRNPKMFPSLTPFQIQMRARLWATVLELACLDSSLPPCISLDDYDTSPPSNYDDQELDPTEATERVPGEGVTDSSIQILLANSLPLRLKVVRLLHDFRHEQSYQTALKVGAELKTACREVASFFHSAMSRPPGQSRSVLKVTDFHRKFLDIYFRTYILLLQRPFMLQSKANPLFCLARKVCVESAMVIGSYANNMSLNLPSSPLDDLSRLFKVGRGVFKGPLSLDVIMVLGLEVVTQLEEEGPQHVAPDLLDEFNKAGRAPLIRTLELISDQLLQIIAQGSASTKRYLLASAYLSQIRAMETGQNVKMAVYKDAVESVKKCHSLLQEQVAQLQHLRPEHQGDVAMSIVDATTTPFLLQDANATGPWDVSYLLDFSLLGNEEQSSWGF